MTDPESPKTPEVDDATNARIIIDLESLRNGVAAGVFGLAFVAVGYALSDRSVEDLASTAWVYLILFGLICSYALAGYASGRTRPAMPMTQGILVGFAMFLAWMIIRALITYATSQGSAFAINQMATNLVMAPTCAMLASRFASRYAPR